MRGLVPALLLAAHGMGCTADDGPGDRDDTGDTEPSWAPGTGSFVLDAGTDDEVSFTVQMVNAMQPCDYFWLSAEPASTDGLTVELGQLAIAADTATTMGSYSGAATWPYWDAVALIDGEALWATDATYTVDEYVAPTPYDDELRRAKPFVAFEFISVTFTLTLQADKNGVVHTVSGSLVDVPVIQYLAC